MNIRNIMLACVVLLSMPAEKHSRAAQVMQDDKPRIVISSEGSGLVPSLRVVDSRAPARQSTSIQLSWTADGLEVVFECTDKDITAEQDGDDGPKLWKDDNVYVWLDPGHTHDVKKFVMIQVSAGGFRSDSCGTNSAFDVEGLEVEVGRTASGWRASLGIPWKGLNVEPPKPGDVWGLNFSRMDQPGKYEFMQMEQSSWAAIRSALMLDTRQWGHLVFSDANTDDGSVAAAIGKTHAVRPPDGSLSKDELSLIGGSVPRYYAGANTKYGEEQTTVTLPIPPWPSQYRLRASDKEKLTPADVAGPDGLVYPNWTKAGVEGGIPDLPVAVKLEDLGAKPGTDIAELLEQACAQAEAKGGGAVLISEGDFHLSRPVVIRQSGVVIRGSGRDKTRLLFRYGLDDPKAPEPGGYPEPAVFLFRGELLDRIILLAEDGKRGDTVLTLKSVDGLKEGDTFVLRAPVTPRWQAITGDRSTANWGVRANSYAVKAIRGNTVEIGEALRIDFPVVDGSEIRLTNPIRRSGLEDLTIEHVCRMQFSTVNTHFAWNCWVRRIDVLQCGRSGVHLHNAKRCEVRDCTFDGFDTAIHKPHVNFHGYGGFTCTWDCLMENTVWRRFRHAPQVQFGAQGNVIRNSVFEGSDAQWHAGWAAENLFENCVVGPTGPYGSYGFGMYSTPSLDTIHGPNGPRNVVYNCDVSSDKAAVYARGASEGWIFAYNRFVTEEDVGFYADQAFFDATLLENIFVVRQPHLPMLLLRDHDCVGFEVIRNKLYGGNGVIVDAYGAEASEEGNRAFPDPGSSLPPRPGPTVPSIYEWQQNNSSGNPGFVEKRGEQ